MANVMSSSSELRPLVFCSRRYVKSPESTSLSYPVTKIWDVALAAQKAYAHYQLILVRWSRVVLSSVRHATQSFNTRTRSR